MLPVISATKNPNDILHHEECFREVFEFLKKNEEMKKQIDSFHLDHYDSLGYVLTINCVDEEEALNVLDYLKNSYEVILNSHKTGVLVLSPSPQGFKDKINSDREDVRILLFYLKHPKFQGTEYSVRLSHQEPREIKEETEEFMITFLSEGPLNFLRNLIKNSPRLSNTKIVDYESFKSFGAKQHHLSLVFKEPKPVTLDVLTLEEEKPLPTSHHGELSVKVVKPKKVRMSKKINDEMVPMKPFEVSNIDEALLFHFLTEELNVRFSKRFHTKSRHPFLNHMLSAGENLKVIQINFWGENPIQSTREIKLLLLRKFEKLKINQNSSSLNIIYILVHQ